MQYLDHWPIYDDLFSNFKVGKFKLKAHQKEFETVADDKRVICDIHAKLRAVSRVEVATLLALLRDFPQLIPVKFQMAMTLLRLASSEIVWLFRAIQLKETHKEYRKLPLPAQPDSTEICPMLGDIYALNLILKQNKSAVQQYYAHMVKNIHLPRLKVTIDAMYSVRGDLNSESFFFTHSFASVFF